MYVDMRGRKIYFGLAECEPSYKIVFQPEKRGPPFDVEHAEFEKCLMRSKAEGFLNETEFERRIRRGRPVTVWTKAIEPVENKKKFTKATGDIDKIIANIMELHKQIAPLNPSPKDEENIKTEKAEESSVKNEEDSEESCMQKQDAAYVGSVCENVYRSSVYTM